MELAADHDLMVVVTLLSPEMPIRGMFFDRGMSLMAGCKSGFSPFVKGMVPKWGVSLDKTSIMFSQPP